MSFGDLGGLQVDKLLFKEYAKEKNVNTPKTYYIYDNSEEIDLDKLPNDFVIKINNGSGKNIIVKDKKIISGNLPKNLDLIKDWKNIKNILNVNLIANNQLMNSRFII